MLSNQEKLVIVDKIIDHFTVQGTFSINGVSCKYRDANGNKCALGALIEDSQYNPAIEGCGVNTLISWYPSKFSREDVNFYMRLQNIHDSEAFIDNGFVNMMYIYKKLREEFE